MDSISNITKQLDSLIFKFKLENLRDLNESQTRLSFIDPFWEILGWNVRNQEEVQIERTDRESKRPDYRFLNKNKVMFFVEAKKPAEALSNPKHIYQTKLYCWNGNVPLAILTDFEEFRPFRSIGKPNLNDENKGIIKKFDMRFEEYPDRAYDLLNTFGREAVLGGSLNDLLKPTKIELRDTVDKHFLNTLSKWRTDLAAEIAKANKFDNEFELSESVQRILDRLVFLRILQDREIETYDYLNGIIKNKKSDAYSAFIDICKELTPKYNGLIFNPHHLSENLRIESGLFKRIVKELDFEESPYRFDEIPVEMLGTIYERFLGDEINLDNKGRVFIDKKPEVRKAGGVYYTPQYIVEYIVQNTVGKLLENCKTPVDVAKLKILDPACGSGSFLLGAFDSIIKWHEEYYSANPTKIYETIKKQSYLLAYLDDAGKMKLTARMKSRILQNNIFGVDLDKQATEVAQMSLYIKVLEGMANESQRSFQFHDAILPKLENNIKCGNSLIGTDFIQDDFFGLSERERRKINPFDWEEEFPEIFKGRKKKFDKEYFETELKKGMVNASKAIDLAKSAFEHTSNAYQYAKNLNLVSEPDFEYGLQGGFDAVIGNPPYIKYENINKHLISYSEGKYNSAKGFYDIFQLFLEKAFYLLKTNSPMGFIFPNLFLKGMNYQYSRKYFAENSRIAIIRNLGDGVFENVKMPTCIVIFEKSLLYGNTVDYFRKYNNELIKTQVDQKMFLNEHYVYDDLKKIDKFSDNCLNLKELIEITRGLEIGRDKAVTNAKTDYKIIFGEDISRYSINHLSYISKKDYDIYKKNEDIFKNPKLVIRETGNRITTTYDENNLLTNRSLYCIRSGKINLHYLLGILNSKLLQYYYANNFKAESDIFPKIRIG
ncbi:MAG: hypothetical protein QG635_871, partial [Bacteroidota bacterium]|nr:hypothetical protein [Bacteroidota bacterium]